LNNWADLIPIYFYEEADAFVTTTFTACGVKKCGIVNGASTYASISSFLEICCIPAGSKSELRLTLSRAAGENCRSNHLVPWWFVEREVNPSFPDTLFRDVVELRRAFSTLNVDLLLFAMTHGQFIDGAIERFEKAMKAR
jgi:hypothetical protein